MMRKFFFLVRYVYHRLLLARSLTTDGFVFFERDVDLRVSPGGTVHLGRRVYLKKGAIIECAAPGRIRIGAGSVIGHYTWIGCSQRVDIGDQCLISNDVSLFDVDHLLTAGQAVADTGYSSGATIVGDDCLIGTKATVGANVTVGAGTVVGANAVVVHDLPPRVIAAGVPARVIRQRP